MVLKEGDTVPGDGVVLDGAGEITESWITGATGVVRKLEGDHVFASSEISRGEIRIRMEATGEKHGCGTSGTPGIPGPSANRSARRKLIVSRDAMVLPALIFGLAALGRGGIHMTKAVLRPDYLSGPAIAGENALGSVN